MPRKDDKVANFFEGCIGILLIALVVGFFYLIHYACNAYPTVESYGGNENEAQIVLRCGSLCDPPATLIKQFEEKNPHVKVDSFKVSKSWNGDTILEIHIKPRNK